MVDCIEESFEVNVYHPIVSIIQKFQAFYNSHFTASFWSKAVTEFTELLFKYWTENLMNGLLNYSILVFCASTRRASLLSIAATQGACEAAGAQAHSTAWLIGVLPPAHRLGSIAAWRKAGLVRTAGIKPARAKPKGF